MPCTICGTNTVSQERVEIGRTSCMEKACVAEYRRRRNDEKGLVPVLLHKQGLVWVFRDEVAKNSMRRSGGL